MGVDNLRNVLINRNFLVGNALWKSCRFLGKAVDNSGWCSRSLALSTNSPQLVGLLFTGLFSALSTKLLFQKVKFTIEVCI